MPGRKGDLIRAKSAGPDRADVEGILNLRYRKAWNRVLVDVMTAKGPVSVRADTVQVVEARKVRPEELDALDPVSWEDGALPIRDLDQAIAAGLVPRERLENPPANAPG